MMSFVFEVYYKPPVDGTREAAASAQASRFGGHLDFREESQRPGEGAICLTYEFDDFAQAEAAAELLRQRGEHVEGPVDYGD
jgi:hypothetical protein